MSASKQNIIFMVDVLTLIFREVLYQCSPIDVENVLPFDVKTSDLVPVTSDPERYWLACFGFLLIQFCIIELDIDLR